MDKKVVIYSLLSGIILFLSFPKFGQGYLVWISILPLFFAIKEKNLADAFRLGVITGFVFNVGIIYWVIFVTMHYGNLPVYIATAVMLLLALYLSIYIGLFALGVRFAKKKGIDEFISAPVFWTVLEYGKSNLLSGFPWENLGHSQFEMIPLIQLADITGVYGLSFLIVLVNALIFDIVAMEPKEKVLKKSAITLVILALALGYGVTRMHYIGKSISESDEEFSVSLIQGNIDQSDKWNPEFQKKTLEIYDRLSEETLEGGKTPDLIVWPETAAPLFFQDKSDLHMKILSTARKVGANILFGSPSYLRKDEQTYLMNSAYLITSEGKIKGRYDKTHLVPFGEYVPFRDILFFVDKMVTGVGDFMPGKAVIPLVLDNLTLGVLICYEGIFPEISRQYTHKGADLLINITNDAWYGRTSAPYQHMSMVIFRAIENRKYLVRSANTGISAVVDPAGRIIKKSGLFQTDIIDGKVKVLSEVTFYCRHGDIFAKACTALSILVLLFSFKRERKKRL
ncbi:MAG: apolipoprotein N-acyltransferase [Syntrophales bacterium]|jgi:apolipoprotein N-acyltransferase|nr:apolipoprotein N-acyltransferase [Syntrophales bacterium]MDY0043844.1 apolipoprotein N-acyltransferase [Syntrophales bacterium]